MAVRIRPATLEDAASIAENIKPASTLEEVHASLLVFQERNLTHLVADDDRRVVANALLVPSRFYPPGQPHRGELADFVIHPSHQRTGLARQLIDGICDAARAQGMTQLEIAAAEDNERAVAAYRGLGFSEWGYLPNATPGGAMTFFYLNL